MYHYTESGLDNVFLVDGYTLHETPYGQGVSIRNTVGLHKAIGKWLIALPKPLNGAEVRFLRLEMECTQRHLGGFLGVTEQSVRLWERYRKKAIPGPVDRLIRALYTDFIGGDGSVRRMLARLAELDQMERAEGCFSNESNHWRSKRSPSPGLVESAV